MDVKPPAVQTASAGVIDQNYPALHYALALAESTVSIQGHEKCSDGIEIFPASTLNTNVRHILTS